VNAFPSPLSSEHERRGKLAYFPQVGDGELVISMLGRLRFHLGQPGFRRMVFSVLGLSEATIALDLPGGIDKIAAAIPPRVGLTADDLLMRHTLFPWNTLGSDPKDQAATAAALRVGALSGNSFSVRTSPNPIHELRFCADCVPEMIEECGELYWKREHQVEAVIVCPKHGSILRRSRIPQDANLRRQWFRADDDSCPPDAEPLVTDLSDDTLADLQNLAGKVSAILSAPGNHFDSLALRERARTALRLSGLMHTPVAVLWSRTRDVVSEKLPGFNRIWPYIFDRDGACGDWMRIYLHPSRDHGASSLGLLMIELFIDKLSMDVNFHSRVQGDFFPPKSPDSRWIGAAEADKVFGEGPWPCLNPIGPHFGQPTVPVVDLRQDSRRGPRGIFRCECGYAYVRRVGEDGRLQEPVRLEHGPTLKPFIENGIRDGWTLTRIARETQYAPANLNEIARRLGVDTPWTIKGSRHKRLDN